MPPFIVYSSVSNGRGSDATGDSGKEAKSLGKLSLQGDFKINVADINAFFLFLLYSKLCPQKVPIVGHFLKKRIWGATNRDGRVW